MAELQRPARLIVFGNVKGGSGKSTCALHAAISLMHAGKRVATVDLDGFQQTFSRAIANRVAWNQKTGRQLVVPEHACIPQATGDSVVGRRQQEVEAFAQVLARMEENNDYVIIDTPGFNTALTRLVHGLADTIVTPVNDSFVDIDLLAETGALENDDVILGAYGKLIEDARRERRELDGKKIDWIVVQNRLTMILSNNKIRVREALERLAPQLGFRLARGVSERVIFREFFPLGVTAFDPLDEETFGVKPQMSHVAARDEFRKLISVITFRGAKAQEAEKAVADTARAPVEKAPVGPQKPSAARPVKGRETETIAASRLREAIQAVAERT